MPRGERQLTVVIAGDSSGAERAFRNVEQGGNKFGATIGKVAVAAGAAAAATGAALFKVGQSFDEAYDTIRVGTGATGRQLDTLKESFRSVVRDVPTDFGTAGQAIADLSTRTGATGKALEDMAKQQLTLARITKTDLAGNIASTTRVFGDWGIATENQSRALDQMFRASQATGIGIDSLASSVVQFGAPLRQMGFSFEQSIALLGKFEKEGVNSELVMGSLRIALGKLARDGKEPVAAFQEQVKAIQQAGDAGKANALALELFGARAGPDMAAAIREGRFEIGELFNTIAGGGDTIEKAGRDTEDFSEKWQRLKNTVFLAIEPIATRVFDAVARVAEQVADLVNAFQSGEGGVEGFAVAMDAVLGGTGRLVPVFRTVGNALVSVGRVFSGVVAFVRQNFLPVILAIGSALTGVLAASVVSAVGTATTAFAGLVATAGGIGPALIAALGGPVTLVVGGLAALAAGLVLAYQRFEGFRNVVQAVGGFLSNTVVPAFAAFGAEVNNAIGGVVRYVQEVWPQVAEAIGHVLNVILAITRPFVNFYTAMWRAWGDDLVRLVRAAFDFIRDSINNALQIVSGIFRTILAVINGDWGRAWDSMRSVFSAVWDQIKNIAGTGVEVLRSLLGGFLSSFQQVWAGAWGAIRDFFVGVWNTIRDIVSTGTRFIVDTFFGIVGGVLDAAAKAFGWIPGLGPQLREAAGQFRQLRDEVNAALLGIKKEVVVAIRADTGNIMAAAGRVGDGEGLVPEGRVGSGYSAAIRYLQSSGIPHRVTSTFRPGAMTSSGNLSLHAIGKAADFVGPNMLAIFNAFRRSASSLRELFYTPAGVGVKNGRIVSTAALPPEVNRAHYSHVHVGTYHTGGLVSAALPRVPGLRPDERLINVQVGERIVPREQEAPRPVVNVQINVTMPNYLGDRREVARALSDEIAEPLMRELRRNVARNGTQYF